MSHPTATGSSIKRVGKHVSDCRAMVSVRRGTWDTPWRIPGNVVYRDAIGRHVKSGHHRWHVIRCNSTNCDAELLVHESWLLRGLPNV